MVFVWSALMPHVETVFLKRKSDFALLVRSTGPPPSWKKRIELQFCECTASKVVLQGCLDCLLPGRTPSYLFLRKIHCEGRKKKVHSKNSYANYVRVGDFGYFQKLDDKMSYEDGQAACHELHGKIIESDERYGNATSKCFCLNSNFT